MHEDTAAAVFLFPLRSLLALSMADAFFANFFPVMEKSTNVF